jgi:hypothetical protein
MEIERRANAIVGNPESNMSFNLESKGPLADEELKSRSDNITFRKMSKSHKSLSFAGLAESDKGK